MQGGVRNPSNPTIGRLWSSAVAESRGSPQQCIRDQQEAELNDLRAHLLEYGAVHSHVVQDVLARLEKTYQAFFRRVQHGEKPCYPCFHGQNHYHSFIYKEYGNGARLDNGALVLSKIGRLAVRRSRPVQVTIKTVTVSKAADGWYVRSPVPRCP